MFYGNVIQIIGNFLLNMANIFRIWVEETMPQSKVSSFSFVFSFMKNNIFKKKVLKSNKKIELLLKRLFKFSFLKCLKRVDWFLKGFLSLSLNIDVSVGSKIKAHTRNHQNMYFAPSRTSRVSSCILFIPVYR